MFNPLMKYEFDNMKKWDEFMKGCENKFKKFVLIWGFIFMFEKNLKVYPEVIYHLWTFSCIIKFSERQCPTFFVQKA